MKKPPVATFIQLFKLLSIKSCVIISLSLWMSMLLFSLKLRGYFRFFYAKTERWTAKILNEINKMLKSNDFVGFLMKSINIAN